MALVSLTGVTVSYGERLLLDNVNLTVATGSRTALVGPNGSGKTTLMRIMAGQAVPDTGAVVPEKDTRVSYVPQSGVVPAGCSLREEAEKAFARGKEIVDDLARLEERLGALVPGSPEEPGLLWKHHALQERLASGGYYAREEVMDRVLAGLGFSRSDHGKPCTAFSAGWQMRIALARAILETPDILLLDEPTNYLDIEARTWMEEFLEEYPGGLLLVSHDRFFLDVVVRSVAEIYMSRVSVFNGNYSHYEEVRTRELAAIMDRWRAQQEEIAHIDAFIRRFRYNASKARLVQSRITALEKIERIEVPPVVKSIHFRFPPPPPCGRVVLSAQELEKSYGGTRVFSGVGVDIARGDKLVVVGVNGAGKSTLLRIISGGEAPDGGALTWGTGVRPAFYSQEKADAWQSDRQVIDELEAVAPTGLIPELRTLLGAFLFRGDDVFKRVSILSGGEKSRLAMLMLLLAPANLLILDEPTNHLDIASKDVLLGALRDFPGTVIFVSHDRHFISHLATAVLEVKNGGARYFPGDYEYYLSKVSMDQGDDAAAASESEEAKPASATQRERQEEKKLKSELRSLEKQETELMRGLEALESARQAIESAMALPEVYANGDRMRELRKEHADNHARHDRDMAAWEDLDARLRDLRERVTALRIDTDSR